MSWRRLNFASTAEWAEARRNGIGASEAKNLINPSQWGSPREVYMRKKGLIPPKPMTNAMWMGHILEPAVAEAFRQRTGFFVDPSSEGDWIAQCVEKPYLQVSPDRLYYPDAEHVTPEEMMVLECKTTMASLVDTVRIGEDGQPEVITAESIARKNWEVQIQYQMGVLGARRGSLAWIDGQNNFGHCAVEFNPVMFDAIVGAIEDFWFNHWLPEAVPDPVTAGDIEEAYATGEPGQTLTASGEMLGAVERIAAIGATMDALKAEQDSLKALIKGAMGTATELVAPSDDPDAKPRVLASWKNTRDGVEFDEKRFAEEQREAYTAYLVAKPGARRFLVKVKGAPVQLAF